MGETITRYVLVGTDNVEQDYGYDDYAEAVEQASRQHCAIIKQVYTLSNSSLIWIPDARKGVIIRWPPPSAYEIANN